MKRVAIPLAVLLLFLMISWTVGKRFFLPTVSSTKQSAVLVETQKLSSWRTFSPRKNAPDVDELQDTYHFLKKLNSKDFFVAVTKERSLMNANTAAACSIPDSIREVHGSRYCEVYVTEQGLSSIQNGMDDYPVGTIIVKWKYQQKEGGPRELATVMRKMHKGYSNSHGDWEFSVVNGEATQVLARGKIESCMSCHDDYSSTGFVTREYLNEKPNLLGSGPGDR